MQQSGALFQCAREIYYTAGMCCRNGRLFL